MRESHYPSDCGFVIIDLEMVSILVKYFLDWTAKCSGLTVLEARGLVGMTNLGLRAPGVCPFDPSIAGHKKAGFDEKKKKSI